MALPEIGCDAPKGDGPGLAPFMLTFNQQDLPTIGKAVVGKVEERFEGKTIPSSSSKRLVDDGGVLEFPEDETALRGEEILPTVEDSATPTPVTPNTNKKRRTAVEGWGNPELAGHSRTLYLGNVRPTVTPREILNCVRGGAVESLRYLSEKNCAFIDFCSIAGALCVWRRLPGSKRVGLGGAEVRFGWAKSSIVNPAVETAIKNGATRCVYVGPWEEGEGALRGHFEEFGMLDMIKVIEEKAYAFVYMTSVADAMKAVRALQKKTEFAGKRVSFGKDRCGETSPSCSNSSASGPTGNGPAQNLHEDGEIGRAQIPERKTPTKTANLRTIYFGGVPEGTTAQDLCNVIRGGSLEKIRITPERKCAFVTFVEAEAAASFYSFAEACGGIWVRGCRLKLGWGQESHVPNAVVAALRLGATRNVYLGNVDLDKLDEADLMKVASAFGPVETINLLRRPKHVVFIAFCCLLDAVKAVEAWKTDRMFGHCTVSFGKDRCAGPLPRLERVISDANGDFGVFVHNSASGPPQLLPQSHQPLVGSGQFYVPLPMACFVPPQASAVDANSYLCPLNPMASPSSPSMVPLYNPLMFPYNPMMLPPTSTMPSLCYQNNFSLPCNHFVPPGSITLGSSLQPHQSYQSDPPSISYHPSFPTSLSSSHAGHEPKRTLIYGQHDERVLNETYTDFPDGSVH